jgi:hypothetical protein
MSQGLNLDQMQQVQHVARLAVLAMCARGVSASEFEASPEVSEVHITVRRSGLVDEELPCDIEFVASTGHALGGMSL